MIDATGWRAAAAILGATVLGIGWPLGLRVKERRAAVIVQQSAASGATVAEGVRSRIFWIVVAVLFCSSISQNGAITHFSAMLTDRGISPGGAALIARLLTGWLPDRFFAPRVAMGLLLVAAPGVLLLSAARSMSVGVLASALIGLGMGEKRISLPACLRNICGIGGGTIAHSQTFFRLARPSQQATRCAASTSRSFN